MHDSDPASRDRWGRDHKPDGDNVREKDPTAMTDNIFATGGTRAYSAITDSKGTQTGPTTAERAGGFNSGVSASQKIQALNDLKRLAQQFRGILGLADALKDQVSLE